MRLKWLPRNWGQYSAVIKEQLIKRFRIIRTRLETIGLLLTGLLAAIFLVLSFGKAATQADPSPIDSDGDGLPDQLECCLDGDCLGCNPYPRGEDSDPNNPDADGDGLRDGDELNHYQTNPANPDTDGDGQNDQAEIKAGNDPRANNQPVISGCFPVVVEQGWKVTMQGENFAENPDSNRIVFGKLGERPPDSTTTGMLQVAVPPGLAFGTSVRVKSTINQLSYSSKEAISLVNPKPEKKQRASASQP